MATEGRQDYFALMWWRISALPCGAFQNFVFNGQGDRLLSYFVRALAPMFKGDESSWKAFVFFASGCKHGRGGSVFSITQVPGLSRESFVGCRRNNDSHAELDCGSHWDCLIMTITSSTAQDTTTVQMATPQRIKEARQAIITELRKLIVGADEAIDQVLVAMFAGGIV